MNDLIEAVLGLAATGVLTLGGFAIRRLADWLKLRADSEVRSYLMAALEKAVEYGVAEARRRAIDSGIKGGTAVQAELARDYMQARVPDALARLGVDTAGLDQMIRARLPKPPSGMLGGA